MSISDCCGAEMDKDMGLCYQCHDHCEPALCEDCGEEIEECICDDVKKEPTLEQIDRAIDDTRDR